MGIKLLCHVQHQNNTLREQKDIRGVILAGKLFVDALGDNGDISNKLKREKCHKSLKL